MQQESQVFEKNTATIARSAHVIGAELEGGLVLLQTKTWTYMDLNETAMAIWRNLEQPQPLSSLVGALTAEFDVDAARCREDIEIFVDAMAAKEFLQVDTMPQSGP